jgi:hypothetical protein
MHLNPSDALMPTAQTFQTLLSLLYFRPICHRIVAAFSPDSNCEKVAEFRS